MRENSVSTESADADIGIELEVSPPDHLAAQDATLALDSEDEQAEAEAEPAVDAGAGEPQVEPQVEAQVEAPAPEPAAQKDPEAGRARRYVQWLGFGAATAAVIVLFGLGSR